MQPGTHLSRFLAHVIPPPHPCGCRLLVVLSFQSRLQIITQTVVAATPELIHVLLILMLVTVMMALQVRNHVAHVSASQAGA